MRASSQVFGPRYWGPEAVLCISVHAIITKLATTGGKMLTRRLLLEGVHHLSLPMYLVGPYPYH